VNSEVKSRAGGKTEIEESNTAASIYSCVIWLATQIRRHVCNPCATRQRSPLACTYLRISQVNCRAIGLWYSRAKENYFMNERGNSSTRAFTSKCDCACL